MVWEPSLASLPPAAVPASPRPGKSTSTGLAEVVVVPLPSWPESLAPQQNTRPSFKRAQLCCAPAVISTAPASPETAAGRARSTVLPSPSCPASLAPQQATVPSLFRAQV